MTAFAPDCRVLEGRHASLHEEQVLETLWPQILVLKFIRLLLLYRFLNFPASVYLTLKMG